MNLEEFDKFEAGELYYFPANMTVYIEHKYVNKTRGILKLDVSALFLKEPAYGVMFVGLEPDRFGDPFLKFIHAGVYYYVSSKYDAGSFRSLRHQHIKHMWNDDVL